MFSRQRLALTSLALLRPPIAMNTPLRINNLFVPDIQAHGANNLLSLVGFKRWLHRTDSVKLVTGIP